MSSLIEEITHLEYLCKGYFNQDWDLEGEGAQQVLDSFTRRSPQTRVTEARDAARDLLGKELGDQELKEALAEAGLEYAPDWEGLSYRGWLELVVTQLSAFLAEGPTTNT